MKSKILIIFGSIISLAACQVEPFDSQEMVSFGNKGKEPGGMAFTAVLNGGPATRSDYTTYSFDRPQGDKIDIEAFMLPMPGSMMSYDPEETPETRSAPVTTMYGTFKFALDGFPVMNATLAADGNYRCDEGAKYSDMTDASAFFCWAPGDAPGVTYNTATGKLTYVTPEEVADQKDLVVAMSSTIDPDNTDPVNVTFSHALAGIQVSAAAIFPDCTVNTVTLKNVYGAGTYDPGTDTWTVDTGSITDIELLPSAVNGITASSSIAVGDHTAMLVPQTLPAGAELVIKLTFNGVMFGYSASLEGIVSEKGEIFTFSGDGTSFFLFEGTATDNFPAGSITTIYPDEDGHFSVLLPYGTYTFNGRSEITSITRTPDWFLARSSMNGMFQSCTNLVSVSDMKLGETATNYSLFKDCTHLESVEFSTPPTMLNDEFFRHCSSLASFDFPENITTIGGFVFYGCSNLVIDDLSLPNLTGSLGNGAFESTKVRMVSNLGSITVINGGNPNGTFRNCTELTEVVLPATLNTIGQNCFESCTALASVSVPESLTTIKDDAFRYCSSLTSFDFPEGVRTVDGFAFQSCSNLVIEDLSLPNLTGALGNGAFESTKVRRVSNLGSIGQILGGNPNGAFRNCTQLTEVVLPETLTTVGDNTFSGCSVLSSVNLPESITTIKTNAFANCTALVIDDLCLPNLTGKLWNGAFKNTQLKRISNLGSITEIVSLDGTECFGYCSSLTSVVLPVTLTTIGKGAFRSCSNLTDFYLHETPPAIQSNTFTGVSASIQYHIPAGSLSAYLAAGVWSGFAGHYVEE